MQLSLNKLVGKSRNYIVNSSFQIKKTHNQNNNINNQNNKDDILNHYYKTIGDINKTYDNKMNQNLTLNSTERKNNNKSKLNNKLNYIYHPGHKNMNKLKDSKKQLVIKPYIKINKTNNNIKSKPNLNNSIKVNKKNSNNCFNIGINEKND